MAPLLIAARKDLRRQLADLPALALWMGIPVVVGVMLFLISGSGSQPAVPRAKVLLVDQDRSALSQFVASGATGGRLGEFLDVERVELEDGERRMARGEASALLVLPKGFGDGLLNETPVEVRLVTNPAQRLLPAIVQEGLEVLVEAAFYAQRLFGEPLRDIARVPSEGPSNAQVAGIATSINERIRSLDGVLLPPVLTVTSSTPATSASGSAAPNFGLLLVPGILLMSILFIAQGTSGDVWDEKRLGTLRRARALPWPMWQFLAGKLLASSVLVAGIAVVGLLLAWLFFDVPARRTPLALGWCWLAGVALLCYFTLLQVAASSQRGAQLLGTIVVFPLIMIGGSFFPFEAMPSWMAAVGRWTPNGLAVVRLREIIDGRVDVVALAASAAAIGAPAVAAFWLASRRLAGRFPVS
jgi:ABC-type multidrug transport system permease subunit